MSSNEPSRNSKKQRFDNYLKYSNIVFQLFAAIFLGVWGGIKLDALLHTKPVITILLSLIGVGGGMYLSLKDFIKPKKKP